MPCFRSDAQEAGRERRNHGGTKGKDKRSVGDGVLGWGRRIALLYRTVPNCRNEPTVNIETAKTNPLVGTQSIQASTKRSQKMPADARFSYPEG